MRTSAEEKENPLESPKIALALGAEIAAPAGASVFTLYIRDTNAHENFIGVYESEEAAQSGLREWILDQWSSRSFQSNPPWEVDYGYGFSLETTLRFKKKWLADHTDEEIIKRFFYGSAQYDCGIDSHKVNAFFPREELEGKTNEQK